MSEILYQQEWKIRVNDYYGPLDVLLDIVHKNHMYILELDINKVTEQYLAYVEDMKQKVLDGYVLDKIADYLYLASKLIYLKTNYLMQLQNNEQNQEEKCWTQQDFVQLLLNVEKYKQFMQSLCDKQNERILMYTKTNDQFEQFIPGDFNYEKLPNKIDSNIFIKYLKEFEILQEQTEQEEATSLQDLVYEIFDVPNSEIEQTILTYLKQHNQVCHFGGMWKDLYAQKPFSKYYFVSMFIACLSLNSTAMIYLSQENDELVLKLINGV